MRSANMFLGALGFERAVMQDCVFEPQPTGQLAAVVPVRPTKKEQGRCARGSAKTARVGCQTLPSVQSLH